jgi:hypothetical protein
MKTFKDYYKKGVLGIREQIRLLDYPELGDISVKIDTGNEAHNVLHGTNIKDGGDTVTFKTVGGKELTLPKIDTIVIHIGSGVKEERPVIRLNFELGGKKYQAIPFSIADRTENEEPILIGEPFLKQTNSIVDSNK